MRGVTRALFLATGLLALSCAASLASPAPGSGKLDLPMRYPGAPKPVYDDPKSPYPMNYSDEAAQTLGVRDGHMDLLTSRPTPNDPLIPVFSAGVGGDGAMLKLQWHPGL